MSPNVQERNYNFSRKRRHTIFIQTEPISHRSPRMVLCSCANTILWFLMRNRYWEWLFVHQQSIICINKASTKHQQSIMANIKHCKSINTNVVVRADELSSKRCINPSSQYIVLISINLLFYSTLYSRRNKFLKATWFYGSTWTRFRLKKDNFRCVLSSWLDAYPPKTHRSESVSKSGAFRKHIVSKTHLYIATRLGKTSAKYST